jgi:hypothetical protein
MFDFALLLAPLALAFMFFWLSISTKNNQPLTMLFFLVGIIFTIVVVAVTLSFVTRANLGSYGLGAVFDNVWLVTVITVILAMFITVIYLIKSQYEMWIEKKGGL